MEQKKFDIELRPDVAVGKYSNLVLITHSNSEFIIDFVEHMPGMPKPQVGSRIIMTPEHAKRLMMALRDNISKYESVNGPIKMPEPQVIPPIGSNAEA